MCKKYEVHSKKFRQVNMSIYVKIQASLVPLLDILGTYK